MNEKKVNLSSVIYVFIIFILIIGLVGMWYYYNHIKPIDNSNIAIKNQINSNNNLKDENIIEKDNTTDKVVESENTQIHEKESEEKLEDDKAKFIIENYLDLQGQKEGNYQSFLENLNLVEDLKIDYEETISISDGINLCKTNIKYDDLKAKLLTYMSTELFEDFSSGFTEKDGYLYSMIAGASGYSFDVYKVDLKNQNGDTYVYAVKVVYLGAADIPEYKDIEATIVKENNKFVLDSYKYIENI